MCCAKHLCVVFAVFSLVQRSEAAASPVKVEGVKTSQRGPLHGQSGDLDFHLEVMLNMNPRPSTTPEPPPGRRTSFVVVGMGNEVLKDASNDLLFGNGGVLSSLLELNCGKFHGSTEGQTALLGWGQQSQDWVLRQIKNILFQGEDALPQSPKACTFDSFKDRLKYFQEGMIDNIDGDNIDNAVQILNDRMQDHDAGVGVRIFYLALPQRQFSDWSEAIARQAEANPRVDTRVLLEPPFTDSTVPESLLQGNQEVYFADHYGGKHMMKVMTSFRQMNAFIDSIWNGQTFDRVRIVDHLDSDVKELGNYFNNVGQVRERVASHLLQVLAHTAMDLPSTQYDSAPGRLKVLEATNLHVLDPSKFGQYRGFLEEKGITYNQSHHIPTYASFRFDVDHPRWKKMTGEKVPFIVETGRGLGASFLEARLEQGAEDHCALVVRVEGLREEEKSARPPARRIHVENPDLCSFRLEMDQMLREGSVTKPVPSLLQAGDVQASLLEKESFLGRKAERQKVNLVDARRLGIGAGPHVVLKYDPREYAPSAYARLFQAAFEGRRDEYVSGREMQRQLAIIKGYEMPPWNDIYEYMPCSSREASTRKCPDLQASMTDILASDLYNCKFAAEERCGHDFFFSKCPQECAQYVGTDENPEGVDSERQIMDGPTSRSKMYEQRDGSWKVKDAELGRDAEALDQERKQIGEAVEHEASAQNPGANNPLFQEIPRSTMEDDELLSKDTKSLYMADREELQERGRMSLLEAIERGSPSMDKAGKIPDVPKQMNEAWAQNLLGKVQHEINHAMKKRESPDEVINKVRHILEVNLGRVL
eukprot:gnl/MRDRNA2_/MRDRNA2_29799_c0_seq1.p1 gnl/MRDRNA2_/MRDRNA2_29799_c0~~gnl/MRDRNA2_/MRDRNA2_29799_c0_seq1.p1  ORF type:complete len:819 (+),score=159.79 gnl/MRDRNA2_/MRDRNA2_29799_c0_seq1:172-2628(+)